MIICASCLSGLSTIRGVREKDQRKPDQFFKVGGSPLRWILG